MTDIESLRATFRRVFAQAPPGPLYVSRAPGRVNLIGEHTDYNDGFVLPMAIDRAMTIVFQPQKAERAELYSNDFNQRATFPYDGIRQREDPPWINYPQGVVWALQKAGFKPGGVCGVLSGNVPIGSGLSSSAAFEVAACGAVCRAGGIELKDVDRARLCQFAENKFVGMRCGIMDQYVSVFAREGHALLIDCKDLTHRHVPIPDDEVAVLVCDTGVKHALVATEYNTRRTECEKALSLIAGLEEDVVSWRDVTPAHVKKHAALLDGVLLKRTRHVVSESRRVIAAVRALEAGDVASCGRLIDASHESLKTDYEVSCEELDTLVELARAEEGVLGARMVGGGFGGCTVNLVRADAAERIRRSVAANYEKATGRAAETFVFKPAQGATVEELDGG